MAIYNDYTKLPIWKDIEKIIRQPNTPTHYRYTAIVHTEKKNLVAYKILSVDTVRNYKDNIADEIHLLAYIGSKDYYRDIYPLANNIEVTLNIEEYKLSRYDDEQIVSKYSERFKAVLKGSNLLNPINARRENISDKELDLTGFTEVRFQLVNRVIEPLRIKQTSGVFSNVTPVNFIRNILHTEARKILVDGKPAIEAIDVLPANNNEVQEHIVVPSGTMLVDIPDVIQQEHCGVYSSGLGSYIQMYRGKLTWFVYSLYNHKRFTTDKYNKAIFYSTDRSVLPASEITYRQEADTLYVLITGKVAYQNDLESNYMDSGSGFKLPHAKSYMRKPVELTGDDVKLDRSRLNYETSAVDRIDNLNYVPRSKSYISSNPYKDYSEISSKSVSQITLEWNHSRYDELYPGMPCKHVSVVNGEVISLTGVILHVHTILSLKGNPSVSTTYTINTVVNIVAEKPTEFLKVKE